MSHLNKFWIEINNYNLSLDWVGLDGSRFLSKATYTSIALQSVTDRMT